MPPVVVGSSRFASALETGEAKLWIVLIGVNDYQDETLPNLRYAAYDCQGVGEALAQATQAFPQKEFFIHHDLTVDKPTLKAIQSSLQQVISSAKTQDTVLLYFSGHGVLDPNSQQTVLCLQDTQKQQLLSTGLCFQDLLSTLGECTAHSQLIWLDACHSGNISLSGARGHLSEPTLINPTPQLLELLRQRAAKSRGFYALLSCDQGQQSWEFPDLGHGVFSYYLMRGLRGEAAGSHGIIDADALYRYVYHQTLQYVEQTNQQLRLINQQKRTKGETDLHPEYSMQTPKRIVEGVGETILGLKPMRPELWQRRQALMVDGLIHRTMSPALCEVFRQDGNFELAYFPQPTDNWSDVRTTISAFLQQKRVPSEPRSQEFVQAVATRLLYLRGRHAFSPDGDAWLLLGDGTRISRAWLRQELRRSRTAQQIVVLDCPGAKSLEDWVEDLKVTSDHGQCILACASPDDEPELFAQVLLEALIASPAQTGLSMAALLARLQTNLDELGLACYLWLSGTQGLIEMLPPVLGMQTIHSTRSPANSSENQELSSADVPLAEWLDCLRPLLLRLVGPIVPSLLEQVSDSLDATNPHQLISALSSLLPVKHRTQFEQEASLLVEAPLSSHRSIEAKAVSLPTVDQVMLNEAHSTEPPKQLDETGGQTGGLLTAEQFKGIEQFLLDLVGPIAPALLNQLSPATCDATVMLEELAVHLSEAQQARLAQHLTLLMPFSSPQVQNPHLSNAKGHEAATTLLAQAETSKNDQVVTDDQIDACEQELAGLIGPIAKFIVTTKRELENQVSLKTFVETLVTEIPDPKKADEFRRKMLRK
jgi:uncharacterized caspase-like protein